MPHLTVKVLNGEKLPVHLSMDIVDTMDGVYAIRKEWLDLENRANDPLTYFQSFDWCEKWCRIYGPQALSRGGRLHIVAIRRKGRLAAMLPLAIENRKGLAFVLRFIGEPLIQYSKILMDTSLLSREELKNCIEHVVQTANADAIYLDHLVHGSPLEKCLGSNACYQSKDNFASVIALDGFASSRDYFSSLSAQSRKGRRRKRRKLEEQGELRFHVLRGEDPKFSELLGVAIGQKSEWLERTGRPAAKVADPRFERMLGELGVDASASSGAVAFALSINDTPIAIEIGFWRLDHYYSYLGSFDQRWADYSPGKLLLEEAIGWAIDNGFSGYDLLGNPSDYKNAMATRNIPLVAFARGKTLAGSAYARFWRPRVKPSVKQTIAALPVSIRQTVFGAAAKIMTR